MPTINSMIDKIFGSGKSRKSRATLILQRQRELKLSDRISEMAEPKSPECDWRRLSRQEDLK